MRLSAQTRAMRIDGEGRVAGAKAREYRDFQSLSRSPKAARLFSLRIEFLSEL
jgi:hypothetical protein